VPRTPITEPHIVVVLDPSLLTHETVEGLREGGVLVVNSRMKPKDIAKAVGLEKEARIAVVDAVKIALETLGVPIVNTAILGALVRATGIVGLETVVKLVKERFKGKLGEANVEAVRRAYESTHIETVLPPARA
jgi:2-oxoacid:acceptor oxidoreductase gamma subunit (pyruvate/2-ketoisovalerate family)